MKKAINISLAQTLFNLEEDAYQKLDEYLKSIRSHFAHTKEQEEIMQDIETRLAELFLEKKKKVIALKEVEMVIASMGTVADFEADDKIETVYHPSPKKKLYRNPEDKVIAGVCSGLAAYFNVKVIWVRLLFVFFILVTSGVGLLVYLLMVLLIPEAKTTAQKLEMEGEPVTLETMTENVKEKAKQVTKNASSRLTKVLSWPFMLIKKIFELLAHYLVPFLRVLLGLFVAFLSISGLIFASVAASMLLAGNEAYFGFSLVKVLSAPLLYLTVAAFYLAALIPLMVILILSISLIRKKNFLHFKLGLTLLLLWIMALVGAGVGAFNIVPKLQAYVQNSALFQKSTKEVSLAEMQINSLYFSDHIRIRLIQGSEPKMILKGFKNELDRFQIREENNTLFLEHNPFQGICFFCPDSQIEAEVTLPKINSISLYDGSMLTVEKWVGQEKVDIQISSNSTAQFVDWQSPSIGGYVENGSSLNFNGIVNDAHFIALLGATLDLSGEIKQAELEAYSGSWINAYLPKIEKAKVTSEEGSNIILSETKELEAKARYGGLIQYEGSPTLNQIEEDEGEIRNIQGAYVEGAYPNLAPAFNENEEMGVDEGPTPSVIEAEGTFSFPMNHL